MKALVLQPGGGSVHLNETEQQISNSRDDADLGSLSEVVSQVFIDSPLASNGAGQQTASSPLCHKPSPGAISASGSMFKVGLRERWSEYLLI